MFFNRNNNNNSNNKNDDGNGDNGSNKNNNNSSSNRILGNIKVNCKNNDLKTDDENIRNYVNENEIVSVDKNKMNLDGKTEMN